MAKILLHRLLQRFGLIRFAVDLINLFNNQAIKLSVENKKFIKKHSSDFALVKEQILEKIRFSSEIMFVMSVPDIQTVLLQLPIIAGIISKGYEPVIILLARNASEARYLYRQIGIVNFVYWDDMGWVNDHSELLIKLDKCENQSHLLEIKWKDISIGKFAVSTLMRRTRSGSINPKDENVFKKLRKLIIATANDGHRAIKLLEAYSPKGVFLIDRGYAPEGPIFEVCIQKNIPVFTMNSSHRDNSLILKRYTCTNANVHPAAISKELWSEILSMHWTDQHWSMVKGEIESCYYSGQWYGEVATQHNTKIYDRESLISALNLDRTKKTILIFPHIFWDATFFWGEDVFDDYESWFRETVRLAWQDCSVNWIIKLHPANLVKNIRDGVFDEFSEEKVLHEFGDVPAHIHIIPADTKISTLSLYYLGDVCLTVRGTVGIEAAAFGLAVVTAGTGRYDRLGFTKDPSSEEDYFALLKNIANLPRPSQDEIQLARRYAYGVFLLRPLTLEAIFFAYDKSRMASLNATISNQAKKDLFICADVGAVKDWLGSDRQDIVISSIANKV